MKAKSILTTLALLAFLSVQPANAQLGNIMNKAKQKAQEAVENATKNVKGAAQEKASATVEQTQETVVQQTQETVQQTQAQVEQDLNKPKPSPEAIAGDSLALREDILPGFTKSIGEIHALYETLDPKVYPNRPYYQRLNSTFYRMHTKLSNTLHDEIYYKKYSKFLTPKQIQRVYELEKQSMDRLSKRGPMNQRGKRDTGVRPKPGKPNAPDKGGHGGNS